MSLFPIIDIDIVFLSLLCFDSLMAMSYVNKYYHENVKKFICKYKLFFISFKNKPLIYADTHIDKFILNAATYGDFDVFNYIYDKYHEKITCHQRILRVLCSWSHLEIAKWFYKMESKNINIHDDHDIIFRNACWYDRIDIVKWIVSFPDTNIRSCFDEAFHYSCMFNNIKIAKLLVSLLPDKYDIKYDNNLLIPIIKS